MKLLLRSAAAIVALLAAGVVLEIIASESGEVVVLTTRDATGAAEETRLWVVDYDGSAWLRSGSTQSDWYQRLLVSPRISVRRGEALFPAEAEPTIGVKATIDGLMNDKYGWADDYISLLFGRDDAMPIRLNTDLGSE